MRRCSPLTFLLTAGLALAATAPDARARETEAALRREVNRLDAQGWIATRGRTGAHLRLAELRAARGDHVSAARLLLSALRTGPQPVSVRIAALEALAAQGEPRALRHAAALAEDGRRFGDAAERQIIDEAAARLGLPRPGPTPPARSARRVRIIVLGGADPALAGAMARAVARELAAEVEITERADYRPREGRGVLARQYSADAILKDLAGETAPGLAVLAVTDHDLYAPGLNFVWASAADGVSVVSSARLRDPDDALTRARLAKQALTSLLDQLGAPRATHPACVNANALDLAEFDAKSLTVCSETLLHLERQGTLRAAQP